LTHPVETAPELPARRPRALLPERIRGVRRPRWWQELLFVGICYELYSLVRNAVPEHERPAFRRAADLIDVERRLHIGVEHSLNAFVASRDALAYVCNYYYATLHFVVTISVMVWLYHRHPLRYRSLRTVLLVTNVVALLGFWLYALAPPRTLAGRGFVDTVVTFHTWGSWGSSGVDSASNQFAAMPSLHIGWSLWSAIVVFSLARRWWVRTLAALYPLCTFFVIIGTANHYVLDAVGGAIVVGAGFLVERLLYGRSTFGPLPVTSVTADVPAPRQPDQAKNTRS
jgi:PAP2 superfamily